MNLHDPLLLDILNETAIDSQPGKVSSQAPKEKKRAGKQDFNFTDVVFTV